MADERTVDKSKGVLLPEECVNLYTEHVTGKELSQEVNQALSSDTTYRLKELTHVRKQALHYFCIHFCAYKNYLVQRVGLHH